MTTEPMTTVIKCRNQNGEVEEVLDMTQEEFDHIISQYSTGQRTYRECIPMSQRITAAKETARAGEQLKTENANSTDAEGFEKAICLMMIWSEKIFRELQKGEDFRIEIAYNAEALKTDFFIFTPTEKFGSNGMKQGLQED